MGCVSSKCIRHELKQQQQQQRHVTLRTNGCGSGGAGSGYVSHVVSLTSSTYGALKLEKEEEKTVTTKNRDCVVSDSKRHQRYSSPSSSPIREEPEVINAWELMEGLEEEQQQQPQSTSIQPKKSPKSAPFLRGFTATTAIDTGRRSPLKFLNQFGSPKSLKKLPGNKENKVEGNGVRLRRLDYNSPKGGILKTVNSCPNSCKSAFQPKGSPISAKRKSFGDENTPKSLQRRSPLFDPELVASYEKELSEEEEQIKRMVWATPKPRRQPRKSVDSHSLLQKFERKCPPGGEDSVVIYTTTLRGIRKTFEDCNKVRSIVESYCVHVLERDVSMDSGFKEELRKLMGTKEVKVPVLFVKGRFVGGAEEVVKLEEEEKLGALFEGMPKAALGGAGCKGCGGVRFVMCMECNGSCKVLDEENKKKTVKCGQCNENGIVQCPLCCC